MVTHIPSPASSSSSLPMTSRSSIPYRPNPSYAFSQAGSESAHRREAQPSQNNIIASRSRSRAPSITSTTSTQSALIPPVARSVAAYPASPPSNISFGPAPSAYKAPSAASTSAARPRHGHRSSSRTRRSRELEPEITNAFPWFGTTGDTEICIRDRRGRSEKKYMLHRLILAQNSKWFEHDIARVVKEHARQGAAAEANSMIGGGSGLSYNPALYRAGAGHGSKLLYEVDWTRFLDEQQRIPSLIRRDYSIYSNNTPLRPPSFSANNKPPLPSSSFFRNIASNVPFPGRSQPFEQSDDLDILTAYDNLFLAFYNHAPTLSTDNIATAYVDSKLLIALASYFGAIDTAGPRVDYHLLQFGSRLWKQIAKYPPSYLKLGYLARSKAIFSEALVHVVGAWPLASSQLQLGMPGIDATIVNLVEDKVDELEDTKLRIEAKLFRISLTTGRGERVGPNNAYVDWLALSFFRQWVADNTAPVPASILKDSATRSGSGKPDAAGRPQPATPAKLVHAYRLMASGGQAYLTYDDCKRFLKIRPEDYSRDNLRRFERRIEECKNLARDIARPLTRNSLQLDVSHGEVAYLTCIRCEDGDFSYIWNDS